MPKSGPTIKRELLAVRRSLTAISKSLERLGTALTAAVAAPAPGAAPSRRGRKLKLSPERRAALQLQGQYIGYMRGLGPRQKSRVKELKAAKGFKQAIALAKKLAGG